MRHVEFESAHPDRYRLAPREGHVLRLALVLGIRQAGAASQIGVDRRRVARTMWLVGPTRT